MKSFDLQEQKEEEKFGWTTNRKTRPLMLDGWAEALLKREVTVYDENTLNEHLSFIRPEKTPHHPAAISGKNDDLVICHAGAWQVVQMVSSESPDRVKKPSQMWSDEFGMTYR